MQPRWGTGVVSRSCRIFRVSQKWRYCSHRFTAKFLNSAASATFPRESKGNTALARSRYYLSDTQSNVSSRAEAVADQIGRTPLRVLNETLSIYDTLDRRQRKFTPREGEPVSMYVCGVTSYDYSHIGHARVYVAFDVLVRVLKDLGHEVRYVRNFTDIDDKIIARAAENGEDPLALSRRFIDEFHSDMDTLGCLRPHLEPKATDHVNDMIESIELIISKGHAYPVEGGDVFFDVQSLRDYGRLSKQSISDSRAGASNRVKMDNRKKHPADFALWKSAKPGEPSWSSPWGPGRPGWHIECSSMIRKLMGNVIDIHGGGQDLVFPHHENELAQSRACCDDHCTADEQRLARFWVHNGFVKIDNEKMSKSLGNFFTIRDVLAKYHGMAIRWFLLSTQYRQPINYSATALEDASARLYYIFTTVAAARKMIAEAGEDTPVLNDGLGVATDTWVQVKNALLDDLNTPVAIAALSEPLKIMNELLVVRKKKKVENRLQKLACYVGLIESALELFGIPSDNPYTLLEELRQLALVRAELSEEQVVAAIDERAQARKSKDFERADAIRLQFERAGIAFQDSPDGTTWHPSSKEYAF